ncbi:MAG TPA: hypothetical protein VFS29_04740 [Motilibacteraceae bacterium]|nr:hypothetical protein [Motilibacteraceae bacterium]
MLAVPSPTLPSPAVPHPRVADWVEEGPGAGAPLLVAFGGMPDDGGAARFELVGLRRQLPQAHGLHLRDPQRAWYLGGVAGVDGGFPGLVRRLGERIEELAPARTVLVGNSAGAYAALAVGAALGVDEVLAFVPRSGLSDEVSEMVGDERLAERRRVALTRFGDGGAPLDLAEHVERCFAERLRAAGGQPPYRTRLRVLHATGNREDSAHAARFRGLSETVVQSYPRGDHQLAKVLRASGELAELVATALRVPLPG